MHGYTFDTTGQADGKPLLGQERIAQSDPAQILIGDRHDLFMWIASISWHTTRAFRIHDVSAGGVNRGILENFLEGEQVEYRAPPAVARLNGLIDGPPHIHNGLGGLIKDTESISRIILAGGKFCPEA